MLLLDLPSFASEPGCIDFFSMIEGVKYISNFHYFLLKQTFLFKFLVELISLLGDFMERPVISSSSEASK